MCTQEIHIKSKTREESESTDGMYTCVEKCL